MWRGLAGKIPSLASGTAPITEPCRMPEETGEGLFRAAWMIPRSPGGRCGCRDSPSSPSHVACGSAGGVQRKTNTGGTDRFLSEELHLTSARVEQEQSETTHPLCLSAAKPFLKEFVTSLSQ